MNQNLTHTPSIALAIMALIMHFLPTERAAGESASEFKVALTLAQKGDAAAQLRVGLAYESGKGVDKNLKEALSWYRKAAAQGSGAGMLQVGYQYESGLAVEKDFGIAAMWFKKAMDTDRSSMAGYNLVRLSRSGAIKETYVGIPVEGGSLTTQVDLTVPIEKALANLKANPREVETGKGYWIGYNPQMLCLGARGVDALPALVQFVRNADDAAVRGAGLLAIHLVGIDCQVSGRFGENFRSRAAREALWELMKVEGLTDQVTSLLKRDPWPADVPAIMGALRTVKGDCPATLNALWRYPLSKRIVDPAVLQNGGRGVRFTKPKTYTDRDYVRLAIDGIRKSCGEDRVSVEEGLLESIVENGTSGNSQPTEWTGTIAKLLLEVKDLDPTFSFVSRGRNVYFYEEPHGGERDMPRLCFCSAATAKKRWLEWWDQSGKDWFCVNH